MVGTRRRILRATRWVKSGLSMMTKASGRAAMIASAVSRIRRKISGNRAGIAVKPKIESSSIGKGLCMPAAAIAWPPTPASVSRLGFVRTECARQRGTQRIAQFFCGDKVDRARPRRRDLRHGEATSLTPTRKILARSAAAITSIGVAIRVLPAVTATPARPARATFSMVCGPMAGRSKRRSCPGLGDFTSTPVPSRAVTRRWPTHLGDPRQHVVGSLYPFDRKHMVVGNDRRLTHIKRAKRGDHLNCSRNVGLVALRRLALSEHALAERKFPAPPHQARQSSDRPPRMMPATPFSN